MATKQDRRFNRKAVAAAVTAAFAAGATQPTGAADITWIGGTGDWNVGANWSSATVPGASDNAFIDGGSATNSVVSLNVASQINNLTISAGDLLGINNGVQLSLNGNLFNAGTLALNSSGAATDLRIGAGTSFSGTGVVMLSNNSNNRIYGVSPTHVLTQGAGHTIQGAGQFGLGLMGLANAGLIDANQSTALTVNLNNAAGVTRTNTGTLRASAGGTLSITQALLDNAGGTIAALDASTVNITGGGTRITGGTLSTSGSGVINFGGGATLDTLTNAGLLRIGNGVQGFLAGTITNTGTIELASTGSTSDLAIAGNVTLAGTGTVTMGNHANNRIYGSPATSVLTHAAGHTIQGAGQIGLGLMGLANAGLIDANQSTALTVNLNNAAGVTRTNTGTLRASAGGTLSITQALLDNAGGTIAALDASTVNITGGGTRITGGTLSTSGSGVINFGGGATLDTLTNAGLLRIGNGVQGFLAGTITNTGTIELASTGATSDLAIAGNVTLAGTGTVTMSNHANNRIYGSPATSVLTHAAGHTIQGAGQIGVGQMGLANAGLIDANQSTALTVSLNNNAGVTRTNSGTLRASAGGTLSIIQALLDNAGGTIAALDASAVNITGGGTRITGGTLSTSGNGVINLGGAATLDTLTNAGHVRLGNGAQGVLAGTVTDNGTIELASTGAVTDLLIAGNVTLAGTGTVTMSNHANNRIYGSPATSVLTHGAGHTIRGAGQIGLGLMGLANAGLIDANQSTALTIQPNAALGPVSNTGTLRGSGTGGLTLTGGTFDNQGTVEALNGSSVTYTASATTANNLAGTLTGGIWRAHSTGAGATITLRGTNIAINAADIYLIGAGSLIQVGATSIDSTLHTNNGALRLQQGRTFNATANSGNFTNGVLLELSDSTFSSSTLTNHGALVSFGNSTLTTGVGNRVTGTGSIAASFGTLTIARGVNMGAGSSMTSNAGATIDLSGAALPSQIGTLANNGALALGAQNLVVTSDYTNANFGVGNAFDRRANVSGGGQIIGSNAAQTVTGNVTAAGANTWTLDLGAVRGGTQVTRHYQIGNSGTGADIRGAVQTGAPGLGGITDGRLSGSGVTAQNFGPVAAGGNTGNLAVTFSATSGGSLAGQSIAVVSNFDNVATQTINLSGVASALAQGHATPSPSVNLGNFRVGGSAPSQAFAVQNTTAGAGAERLGIASAGATGNFSATNVLGGGFIDPGVTQAGAVTATVAGGVAGVNNGTLTIQYTTNGQLIDPSFTTINANSQSIALSATGFNAAIGSATPVGPVNLGNVRIGGSLSQAFTVSNTAPAGAFSEDLHAAFGASTGAASHNGGSVNALLAGASNNAAMGASLDTASAGAKSGTVTINYQTAGAVNGVGNGLGAAAAGSQTIAMNGNVYQLAAGQLNTTALNFGTVQVGQSVSQNLSISNVAVGPAGFVEDLNASFGGTSGQGAGQIFGTGSISGLTAGSTNTSSMAVSVNTSIAGTINGAIAVNYFSAGTVGGVSNGLGALGVGSDSFGVSGVIQAGGQVIDQAKPVTNGVISPGAVAVNLGNVRVGTLAQQALSVVNQTTGNAQAALNASIASNGAPVTASGSFDLLGPGSTDTSSLVVGMNTATAGAKTGSATVSFVSDASNVGGCAPNCQLPLPGQTVNVSGAVFQVAQPGLPTNVDLGNFRLGSAPSQALAIGNTDVSPTGYQEGLDASVKATSGKATASGGPIVNLAQGASSTAIGVGLSNTTAGVNQGTVTLALASNGTGTSGLPTLALADAVVNVTGTGYRVANPTLDTPSVTIAARVGDAVAANRSVSITNTSPDAFTEGLKVTIGGISGNASSNGGSIANLAAGASNASAIKVGLGSTASAGTTSGTVTLHMTSTGAGTTGAADLALAPQDVTVNGKVYTPAVRQLNTVSIDFGIVRRGDVVAAHNVSVTNAAASTALNDTMKASMGAATGPFTSGGTASGLGAGQSNPGGTLIVGLDTTTAGIFSGAAGVNFVSQNPDMDDLDLGALPVSLTGQVNNVAEALFVKLSGAGTLTREGSAFTLDLGTVFVGDSFNAVLGMKNNAVGPAADSLSGLFDLGSADDFAFSGWDPIDELGFGLTQGGLQVSELFSSEGLFEDLIRFDWASVNGANPDLEGFFSTLTIRARVVQEGNVPEPGTISLILLAAALAFASRRQRRLRVH